MSIWVDADGCPKVIREIIIKAALRTKTLCTLVANHPIPAPNSPWIKLLQVSAGFDVADNEIVKRVSESDLVITSDIPLAAEVVGKKARVITPRGEELSKENVGARLNLRDFYDTMRSSGIQSAGPPAMTETDKRQFANQLDRYLAQLHSGRNGQ